jgi:hypothetical protein
MISLDEKGSFPSLYRRPQWEGGGKIPGRCEEEGSPTRSGRSSPSPRPSDVMPLCVSYVMVKCLSTRVVSHGTNTPAAITLSVGAARESATDGDKRPIRRYNLPCYSSTPVASVSPRQNGHAFVTKQAKMPKRYYDEDEEN